MKHGNIVVMAMRPYDEVSGPMYTVSSVSWYGIFCLAPYKHGNAETVEASYKINLKPMNGYEDLFPSRAWYTDIFNGHRRYKEFDAITEYAKAEGFCKVQNDRLTLLRTIMRNPEQHIWFKDTKNDVHCFYYDSSMDRFYEKENGHIATDEDNNINYATVDDMEKIMFEIDWEYNKPMELRYNKWYKRLFSFLF